MKRIIYSIILAALISSRPVLLADEPIALNASTSNAPIKRAGSNSPIEKVPLNSCAFAISNILSRALANTNGQQQQKDLFGVGAIRQLKLLREALKADRVASETANSLLGTHRSRDPVTQKDIAGTWLAAYEFGEHTKEKGSLSSEDYVALMQRIDALENSINSQGEKGHQAGYWVSKNRFEIERLLETLDDLSKIEVDDKANDQRKLLCLIGSTLAGIVGSIGYVSTVGHQESRADERILSNAQKSLVGSLDRHLELYRKALTDLPKIKSSDDHEKLLSPVEIDNIIKGEESYIKEQIALGNTPTFGARDISYRLSTIYDKNTVGPTVPSQEDLTKWVRERAYRDPKHVNEEQLEREYSDWNKTDKSSTSYFNGQTIFTPDEMAQKKKNHLGDFEGFAISTFQLLAGTGSGFLAGAALCGAKGGKLVVPQWLRRSQATEELPKPEMPGPLEGIRTMTRAFNAGLPQGYVDQHKAVIVVMPDGNHLALIASINKQANPELTLTIINLNLDHSYLAKMVDLPLSRARQQEIAKQEAAKLALEDAARRKREVDMSDEQKRLAAEAAKIPLPPYDPKPALDTLKDVVLTSTVFIRRTKLEQQKPISNFITALKYDKVVMTEAEVQILTHAVDRVKIAKTPEEAMGILDTAMLVIRKTRKDLLTAQLKADQSATEPNPKKVKLTEAELDAAKKQFNYLLDRSPFKAMLSPE